jgi:ribonucleoside-triphosphate reductase
MLGVSFLPGDDHVYQQAPYEDIDEEEYQRLLAEIPENIDWSLLSVYENSDQTEGAKELACVAGQCEL